MKIYEDEIVFWVERSKSISTKLKIVENEIEFWEFICYDNFFAVSKFKILFLPYQNLRNSNTI